jgi:hypothetical protein
MKLISIFILSLALLLAIGSGNPVRAQNPTPTPTPTEEELKLQAEKRLLELQRDIELAKKAIRDAQPTEPEPPEPKATPLEGNTTLTDVRIETSMVTYKAMSDVADAIAKEIKSRFGLAKSFLIYDAQTIRDWRFHQALFPAFKGQTDDLTMRYQQVVCNHPQVSQEFKNIYCGTGEASPERSAKAVTGALAAGETLIKSFIDLAALFRTETKIEGVAVTIEERAFVAEAARALRNEYHPSSLCDNCKCLSGKCDCKTKTCVPSVFYPAAFHPRIKETETIRRVGLLFVFKTEAERIIKLMTADRPQQVNALNKALSEKAEAEDLLDEMKSLDEIINNLNLALKKESVPYFRRKLWDEKTKAEVARAALGPADVQKQIIEKAKTDIENAKAKIKQIDDPVKGLTELNDRFQTFVDQFIKVDEKGSNSLALFIKSEDIDAIINEGESYWLEIKSVIAGGNNRTRKNLIWFFAGARVDHSGGVIAEYTLYDKFGAIVTSDKIAYYNGYVEPKKMQQGKLKDTVR